MTVALPAWKKAALAALPWTLAATSAALLIMELPDMMAEDWPSHDPRMLAMAALSEAERRLSLARADNDSGGKHPGFGAVNLSGAVVDGKE